MKSFHSFTVPNCEVEGIRQVSQSVVVTQSVIPFKKMYGSLYRTTLQGCIKGGGKLWEQNL